MKARAHITSLLLLAMLCVVCMSVCATPRLDKPLYCWHHEEEICLDSTLFTFPIPTSDCYTMLSVVITGINRSDQLNGGSGVAKIDFDEATLYPFQYLTIKPQYYTKHYFIGKEHIATNFGNGGFEKVTPNTERKPKTTHESQLIQWFYNKQWDDPYVFRINTVGETTKNIDFQGLEYSDLQYQCNPTIVADLYASWRPRLHNVIGNNLGILNKQEEPYFYHNDHLGSTKLVMDARGRIYNEIDYMPFGETFHSNGGHSHLEEHKFTGKERDEETQYDYFGAKILVHSSSKS